MTDCRVVLIGAGNVATRLGEALHEAGVNIVQVYNRTETKAAMLADRLGAAWTACPRAITANADLYLFALKDDALPELLPQIPSNGGLWVHTSGSLPATVFAAYTQRFGVLYPLQTFSKGRPVDLSHVPFCIEAACTADETTLCALSQRLSNCVHRIDSARRRLLHLSAVFACNFTNHMYTLAARIAAEAGIDTALLLPLIDETAAKIHTMAPHEAQTGPAVRNDRRIIDAHLSLLTDPQLRRIYQLITNHIQQPTNNE